MHSEVCKFNLNAGDKNLCLSKCLIICSTKKEVCVTSRDNLTVKVDHRVRNLSAFMMSEVLCLAVFKHSSNHSEALVSHFVISQFHFGVNVLFLF